MSSEKSGCSTGRKLTSGLLQEFSVPRLPLIIELGQPGCSVHGVVAALWGVVGCPSTHSEPQGGRGAEAMSPAAHAPSCVPQCPPRSGEKPPGTESWGLGGWQIATRICIFLSRLTQCENWLVVGQWSTDMCLSFSHQCI